VGHDIKLFILLELRWWISFQFPLLGYCIPWEFLPNSSRKKGSLPGKNPFLPWRNPTLVTDICKSAHHASVVIFKRLIFLMFQNIVNISLSRRDAHFMFGLEVTECPASQNKMGYFLLIYEQNSTRFMSINFISALYNQEFKILLMVTKLVLETYQMEGAHFTCLSVYL